MAHPPRHERKQILAITLALSGFFGTLILSQFPTPLNYILMAVGNWCLCFYGMQESMKTRHLIMGKYMLNSDECNRFAIPFSLIISGLYVVPFIGSLLAYSASIVLSYLIPDLIDW